MSSVWDHIKPGNPEDGFRRGRLKIRRPVPGERYCFVALEGAVGWYLTHYLDKLDRTRPCLGEDCFCQSEELKPRVRWDGWIVGLDIHANRVVLNHLTFNTWKTCEHLRDRSLSLRGARITLARPAGSRNGVVTATVEPHAIAERRLPRAAIHHREALLYVWFDGKDSYEEVVKYADLYGTFAPVAGSESQAPQNDAEKGE